MQYGASHKQILQKIFAAGRNVKLCLLGSLFSPKMFSEVDPVSHHDGRGNHREHVLPEAGHTWWDTTRLPGLLSRQELCDVEKYIKEIYIPRTRSEKCKIWEIYNLLSEQHVWSCFYTGAVLHGGGDICTESKQLWSISGHMVQGQKFFFLCSMLLHLLWVNLSAI